MELRTIIGYPKYKATSEGDILSCQRDRNGLLVKGVIRKSGFSQHRLIANKKHNTFLTHRIIAETFIPNPDNLTMVKHKDGDILNNKVSNLEWK